MAQKILEVNHLKINFQTFAGTVQAIRDVSFNLKRAKPLLLLVNQAQENQ